LVTGPVALKPPSAAEIVQVESAEQMRSAVLAHAREATIVIKAAAVADFTVKDPSTQKMKRKGALAVELQPTADILAELGSLKKSERRESQLLIGFAAETENVLENARQKLRNKGVDAVVVNDVSQRGIGFDSERNAVTIITSSQVVDVPETSN